LVVVLGQKNDPPNVQRLRFRTASWDVLQLFLDAD
jgi:hypothetical protein